MYQGVSPDAFSKTLNVSSNRANAGTRKCRLDAVAGMYQLPQFVNVGVAEKVDAP